MDNPRAVLFDMDGVLVDSFTMWLHAMNDVAAELGHPPIEPAAFEAAFGQGVEDDLRTFYQGSTRVEVEAAQARALPRHAHRLQANPAAREVLVWLAERGLARAVVTNTQHDAVDGLLAHAGLAGAFDVVIGVSATVRGKPAPDLLLRACDALAVDPADALMVGDTSYDRGAAEAARTAYVHYELRRGDDLAATLQAALGIR